MATDIKKNTYNIFLIIERREGNKITTLIGYKKKKEREKRKAFFC